MQKKNLKKNKNQMCDLTFSSTNRKEKNPKQKKKFKNTEATPQEKNKK